MSCLKKPFDEMYGNSVIIRNGKCTDIREQETVIGKNREDHQKFAGTLNRLRQRKHDLRDVSRKENGL